jgi:hypothetical protein
MELGKAKRWGSQFTQKIAESKPVNSGTDVQLRTLWGSAYAVATDFHHDKEWGLRHNKAIISSISEMNVSEAEKKMIFEDNARNLLRLPV